MSKVAFTVGNTHSYDLALYEALEDDPVKKVGRNNGLYDDYGGGWVWATEQEAADFLQSSQFDATFPGRASEFAVYRLELPTDWDTDVTTETEDDGVHRLLNDAVIVERVP